MKECIAPQTLIRFLFVPCKSCFKLPRALKMLTRFANANWNFSDVNNRRSCFTWATSKVSVLFSFHRSELTFYLLTSTEYLYETGESHDWNLCSCAVWKRISYGQRLVWRSWRLVWLGYCKFIFYCSRESHGGQSLFVDPTVKSYGIGTSLVLNPLRDSSIAGTPSLQTHTS